MSEVESKERVASIAEEAPIWSKLAIATFVLSLASPLAMVTEFLWPTTFLTIVFGIAAIVLTARGGESVRGGWLATFAVFLSLFSLSFAITRYAAHQNAMNSEAISFAEQWFAMIKEGKLNEAHQMSMGFEHREAPEIPISEAYRLNEQAKNNRDAFFLQLPIKYLVKDPQNSNVRFLRLAGREVDEKADVVKLRFSIRYRELEVPHEITFTIGVARYRHPQFEDHRWMIRGVSHIETK
jgi:hypothetical protein